MTPPVFLARYFRADIVDSAGHGGILFLPALSIRVRKQSLHMQDYSFNFLLLEHPGPLYHAALANTCLVEAIYQTN